VSIWLKVWARQAFSSNDVLTPKDHKLTTRTGIRTAATLKCSRVDLLCAAPDGVHRPAR
jgi:hypothetical protein